MEVSFRLSQAHHIPLTVGRFVKTNILATVSELHSDQITLRFSDLRITLFNDHFDAVRVADDV